MHQKSHSKSYFSVILCGLCICAVAGQFWFVGFIAIAIGWRMVGLIDDVLEAQGYGQRVITLHFGTLSLFLCIPVVMPMYALQRMAPLPSESILTLPTLLLCGFAIAAIFWLILAVSEVGVSAIWYEVLGFSVERRTEDAFHDVAENDALEENQSQSGPYMSFQSRR
jgi:hypothetical protein